jgi:hypothetical protein
MGAFVGSGARAEVLNNDRSRSKKGFFATVCSTMRYFPFSKIALQASVQLAAEGRFGGVQDKAGAKQ